MVDAKLISLSDIELTRFLLAIILLLGSSHFFGYIFQRLSLPSVAGEILGGIVLGPSFMGHFFPWLYNWVFAAFESEGKLISSFYWLGLVLLMFISGFEAEKSLDHRDKKIIGSLILATILPFFAGLYITPVFLN